MQTSKNKTIFVTAVKNIKAENDILINKNDVGIVQSIEANLFSVFFIRIWDIIILNRKSLKIFNVLKTGDSFPRKICNICHKLLNTSEFAKNQNGKGDRSVRRPSCSDCRKKLEGVDVPMKVKLEWNKCKPFQTPFECPICAKRTIAGITSKIVLDHNHRNGKVRGWVCDSCNTGIGRFKDDIELVNRAIKFIKALD